MSVRCIPSYTPLLYRKTEVCRGIPIFLIFTPKIDCGYSLEAVLTCTHSLGFEKKKKERYRNFFNLYPLIPHFYIEKQRYAGYTYFSYFYSKIDCVYPQSRF